MAEEKQPADAAAGMTPAAGAQEKAPSQPLAAAVEDVADDVPDPDEDDLDDLDDLLDDFSAANIESKAPELPPAPGAIAGKGDISMAEDDDVPNLEDILQDDDFAKQLQAGMADLLGEIQTSPEMQAQFENLFKELGEAVPGATGGAAASSTPSATTTAKTTTAAATAAAEAAIVGAGVATAAATKSKANTGAAGGGGGAPADATASSTARGASGPSGPSGPSGSADGSFQDTIRRTMERMQASGEQATAAATADSNSADDLLSEFMKQMQSGGLGGGGGANEDDLSKMLVGMMEELTNREILYEPMKELHDKFPAWMEQNQAATAPDDLKRYREQQAIVSEIVARFELATYSDTNPADREYIVDRMQKMQAAGSPPPDLVGDMPSAQEALAPPDESCNPQ